MVIPKDKSGVSDDLIVSRRSKDRHTQSNSGRICCSKRCNPQTPTRCIAYYRACSSWHVSHWTCRASCATHPNLEASKKRLASKISKAVLQMRCQTETCHDQWRTWCQMTQRKESSMATIGSCCAVSRSKGPSSARRRSLGRSPRNRGKFNARTTFCSTGGTSLKSQTTQIQVLTAPMCACKSLAQRQVSNYITLFPRPGDTSNGALKVTNLLLWFQYQDLMPSSHISPRFQPCFPISSASSRSLEGAMYPITISDYVKGRWTDEKKKDVTLNTW